MMLNIGCQPLYGSMNTFLQGPFTTGSQAELRYVKTRLCYFLACTEQRPFGN